jgi:hypothetical protein
VADDFAELFDRERLLGGLPAKRASTLLFLIESRTARLTAQSRQAMQRFVSSDAAQARELEFIEAFALGREPPVRPTVQDLERCAPQWASLMARNPRVQAALALRMSEKYGLGRGRVEGIAAALGLDDARVGAAFESLYARPLDSIYVERVSPRERLRWAQAGVSQRLERLSPFWTAYALTLTETVGSTIVALPIAVAAIGPLPAVAILVLLGLLNVLTVAFMADALTRSATIRYGNAYIGRVVTDLLGRPGALVLTVGLVGICLMGMQADYIGVSATLTDVTGVPAVGFVALLFCVELLYLRRGSIDATVTSALVIGAVNLALILAICLLAFAHTDASNLSYVALPFVGDAGFHRSSLALVFGVTFTAYFGHLSVSNCARVVLARDASGRTLVRGVMAAQVTAIAVYVGFVVAVAGAVSPGVLAAEAGTALSPLADVSGPLVLALGGVLVVLGMGMASIHSALALFYVVRERLPSPAPRTLVLPRRGARIVLSGGGRRGGRVSVMLTYVGVARGGGARFRLDVADGRAVEGVAPAGVPWEPFEPAALRDLRDRGFSLRIAVLSATDHEVRVEVSTSLRLGYEGEWDSAGVSLSGILSLSDQDAGVLAWLLRRPDATVAQVAAQTELGEAQARALLAGLVERGLLAERLLAGEPRYVASAGRRRGGRLSAEVWEALREDHAGRPAPEPAPDRPAARRSAALGEWARHRLSGERARFAAGVSPVLAVFLFAAWQATTGHLSLADVLSFLGVIIVALLAGVFPVLLLVAARRRGELAAGDYRLPAGRWVLGAVYVVALGGVALHGIALWEDPLQRAAALAVTALALGLTVSMVRSGTFTPRATLELRAEPGGDAGWFSLVAAGRAVVADVVLAYADGTEQRVRAASGEIARFDALRRVTLTPEWPAGAPAELKLWAHRVTADDESQPLEWRTEIVEGDRPPSPLSQDDSGQVVTGLPTHGSVAFVIGR